MSPKNVYKHNYRPDIDGLRAIAVLVVILYHFAIPGFPGGYIGVDIFFVISGYLISGMLYKTIQNKTFSFFEFYEKRIRRLYPAMSIVIVFTILFYYALSNTSNLEHFSKSLLYLTFFSTNFLFLQETGYFDIGAIAKPLLHTWSLAIEEQFYIIWPLTIIFTYKLKVNKKLIIIFLTLISFILSIKLTYDKSTLAYYLLPTRAFELLLGCYAATLKPIELSNRLIKITLSLITFLCILLPIYFFNEETAFPGYLALIPCIGAFIIIISSAKSNYINALLYNSALIFIGLISYPLYLWHWPLLVYYTQISDALFEYYNVDYNFLGISFLLILTFLFSFLTYRLVETPIRNKKILKTSRSIYIFFIMFTLLIASISLIQLKEKKLLINNTSIPYLQESYAENSAKNLSLDEINLPQKFKEHFQYIGDEKKVEYILWGDSQAEQLLPIFSNLYSRNSTSGLFIYSRVPAYGVLRKTHEYYSVEENKTLVNFIVNYSKDKKIKNIIISSLWNYFVAGVPKEHEKLYGIKAFEPGVFGESNISSIDYFEKQFLLTIEMLRSSGTSVWIVLPFPEANIHVKPFLSTLNQLGIDGRDYVINQSSHNERSKVILKIFSQLPKDVNFIDPTAYLCENNLCPITRKERVLYHDASHINSYGALELSSAFNFLEVAQ